MSKHDQTIQPNKTSSNTSGFRGSEDRIYGFLNSCSV